MAKFLVNETILFIQILNVIIVLFELFTSINGLNNTANITRLKIGDYGLSLPTAIFMNAKALDNCENVRRYGPKGTISTINYPNNYKSQTSCMWHIIGLPNEVITISFDDLDLEVPDDSRKYCAETRNTSLASHIDPCCAYNWIKIGPTINGSEQRYCGHITDENSMVLKTFTSAANQVTVKFHTAPKVKGGRGFHLSYIVGPKTSVNCNNDEFHCANGKCILGNWRCNRRNECEDGSDEIACDDICLGADERKCGSLSHNNIPGCYSFSTQRCNFEWDCENGADEKGCGGCPNEMFMCRTGVSCYSEAKRCDGVFDCVDYTDELNCGVCGVNKTLCGTVCYNPFTQRCNRILDCPNGDDEKGCIHGCHSKILCASGFGCYSNEERCNGVPECNDFSDEKNCTVDLCRIERGSFLCNNGRCIRSVWMCDRSNDCGDSSDEINCLKNSVITAAIMGSLICGLLLVIAISCTCKLIALRRVEHHHLHHQLSPSHIAHHYDRSLGLSDSETALFRLENGFFFRDPPPSYSAAVGSVPNDRSNSYIEQIRQIRRQRRLRRNRRRPPTPPPIFGDSENTESSSNSVSTNVTPTNESSSSMPTNGSESQCEFNDKDDNIKDESTATTADANRIPIGSPSSTSIVHIELDNIPILSHNDCDSQPLIS